MSQPVYQIEAIEDILLHMISFYNESAEEEKQNENPDEQYMLLAKESVASIRKIFNNERLFKLIKTNDDARRFNRFYLEQFIMLDGLMKKNKRLPPYENFSQI